MNVSDNCYIMSVSYSCRQEEDSVQRIAIIHSIYSLVEYLKSPANILVLYLYFILNLIHFMIVFSDLIVLFNAVYPIMPHFKFIKRSTVCIQASFSIIFQHSKLILTILYVYDSIHHRLHCFFKYVQMFKVILYRFQMRAHQNKANIAAVHLNQSH